MHTLRWLALFTLSGCQGLDGGLLDSANLAAGGCIAGEDGEAPDFSLADLNPASARYSQQISPRDYLEEVSGWYFIHST